MRAGSSRPSARRPACAPPAPRPPHPTPTHPNPYHPPTPPPRLQAQLQLFCAAYLGVQAGEVLLSQADRLGFTLLGAPAQQAQQAQQAAQRWRQFRIGSARELRGRQQFLELLQQMRAEVAAAGGAA